MTVRDQENKLVRGDLTDVQRVGDRMRAERRARRAVFRVEGMDCADEVRLIEAKLGALPGISRLGFDLLGRRLTVEGPIAETEVIGAVGQLGMTARVEGSAVVELPAWRRHLRLTLAAASGVMWGSSLLAGTAGRDVLEAGLAVGALVAGGWTIVPRGLRAALNRAHDMNFLMSVAALGAVLIGEYGEAAGAMFLFAVAQLLETHSMDRARRAIRGLMDLSPAEALVVREGVELQVRAEDVTVGDVVVVRPGEKVPVDGEVLEGRSSVDQSPITGESMPVEKEPGAEVFAGTLNGPGVLEVRSTRLAADTTLARIVHAVDEAQSSRAPTQAFVDRFARIYTPAVVTIAAGVAVLPPLVGLGAWGEWFYRALVLLVVACPCALVISTPVTIVSALAGTARRGILVKGGVHLESLGAARVVAFDKTGTLTAGQPVVVEVAPLAAFGAVQLLSLAASAESRSEHPLGRAVVRRAADAGASLTAPADVTALPGRGLRARVGEQTVHVGGPQLFRNLGAWTAEAEAAATRLGQAGRTVAVVGVQADGHPGAPVELRGLLGIADAIRPEAPAAILALRELGVEHVVMVTGDHEATARAVAAELEREGAKVDAVRAGLLPDEKTEVVRDLLAERGAVAFVGDGINDAPALATATVGVAMGAAGTDVALETADVALMGDDLSKLPLAVRMARKASGIVRANIAFSILVKVVFVGLSIAGLATLWMAVFADMGASLLVILNGLRALHPGASITSPPRTLSSLEGGDRPSQPTAGWHRPRSALVAEGQVELRGPDLGSGVPLSVLPEGAALGGHAHGEPVVVVRRGDEVFVIGAVCTHYGGPLAEGLVVGDTVRCPWHHACFSLRTGEALRAPALKPVARWRTQVRDGSVYVTEELASGDGATPEAGRHVVASPRPASIVVVGAGAAGSAAAEMLRREGYEGPLTMIDPDDAAPYDRPNLSKDYLAGTAPEEWIPLRGREFYSQHGVDFRRGVRVVAVDSREKQVLLTDGQRVSYDRLLLAPGAEPIRLDVPGGDLPHVRYLRSLADSREIVARAGEAKRVVIVGAGFIGLEVAASLRARGLEVHLVTPAAQPLERVLGLELGAFLRALHERHGVVFHPGRRTTAITNDGVTLDDGRVLPADLVVIGVGVRPVIDLAVSAGAEIDGGVLVDEFLQTAVPRIFAAGDIARWPDTRSGDAIRVEHWIVAQRQGQTAARNMLGSRERFDAVPFFWTAQYETTVLYVGHATAWDRAEVEGDLAAGEVVVRYRSGGRTQAVATVGRDRAALEAEWSLERLDWAELDPPHRR